MAAKNVFSKTCGEAGVHLVVETSCAFRHTRKIEHASRCVQCVLKVPYEGTKRGIVRGGTEGRGLRGWLMTSSGTLEHRSLATRAPPHQRALTDTLADTAALSAPRATTCRGHRVSRVISRTARVRALVKSLERRAGSRSEAVVVAAVVATFQAVRAVVRPLPNRYRFIPAASVCARFEPMFNR